MTTAPRMPELVQDSRLEVTFYPNASVPNRTIHTRPSSRRTIKNEIWIREKRLGAGGYGTVWLERRDTGGRRSHEYRAVKELRIRSPRKSNEDYVRELEALAKFSQERFVQFFVKFYGWFEAIDTLFIAMEYYEHGDLKKYLAEHGPLPEDQVQDITWQVLQGLLFMHKNEFAHRDLKPANILIKSKPPEEPWQVKICDLGLSKRVQGTIESTTIKGTPGFMAPELIPGLGEEDIRFVDPFPVDIWALGETTFHMLTCQATFDNSQLKLLDYLKRVLPFPWKPLERVGASGLAVDFVRLLMMASPSNRLTAKQANEHDWMNEATESPATPPDAACIVSRSEFNASSMKSPSYMDDMAEPSAQWTTTGTAKVLSSRFQGASLPSYTATTYHNPRNPDVGSHREPVNYKDRESQRPFRKDKHIRIESSPALPKGTHRYSRGDFEMDYATSEDLEGILRDRVQLSGRRRPIYTPTRESFPQSHLEAWEFMRAPKRNASR
ncbi:kinase-like domain-containing protein [Hypoxylon sp. FL1857]|nr:kinase-like domain-containing protein [Hypoxylon sp. FL1857]